MTKLSKLNVLIESEECMTNPDFSLHLKSTQRTVLVAVIYKDPAELEQTHSSATYDFVRGVTNKTILSLTSKGGNK